MNDLKGIIEDCNKSDLVSYKIIKKIISIIGQEKWQDLHDENNDICTTMGELIITLKGIADLEKENAELKRNKKTVAHLGNVLEQIQDEKIAKAKEIIEKLRLLYFSPVVTKDDVKRQDEILAEAEQFLK